MLKEKDWQTLNARVVKKNGTTKDYFIHFYAFVIPELSIMVNNGICDKYPEINACYCIYVEKGKNLDSHKSLKPDGSYFNSLDEIKDTFRRCMQEQFPESTVIFE